MTYTPITKLHWKTKDLTGKRFGRLVPLAPFRKEGAQRIYWLCQCDCGIKNYVHASNLVSVTRSCGCLRDEIVRKRKTKNPTYTPTHHTWLSMRQRCNNPSKNEYPSYGGRGIKVCARWDNYDAFVEDMGLKPEGMSLDRIDNDGDYTPENCRWATLLEQANNKRSTLYVTIDGTTKPLSDWARVTGIKRGTIRGRMKSGKTGRDLIKPVKS